jgi:hypothetical protein
MSLNKLEELISKHPDWRQSISELLSLFTPGGEYTFAYLVDRLPEMAPQTISVLLSELGSLGIIDRLVRVESPETGGGIKDFASLLEVPDEIYDFRTEKTIPVTPDNLITIYRVLPRAA